MKVITYRRAARYLGAKTRQNAESLSALLNDAELLLSDAAVVRSTLRRLPAWMSGDALLLHGLPAIESPRLAALFSGAKEAVAALVTLGGETDALIRRKMLTEPALGVAIGALASAYVEEALESLLTVEADKLPNGFTLSPRFSPGYGDVPLAFQRPLLDLLGARRIGVTLTGGFLMLPEKSVTALCAVLRAEDCPCPSGRACDGCPMIDCAYREDAT